MPRLLLIALALALGTPASAGAAEIVTWSDPAVTQSQFVGSQAGPVDVYLPSGYESHPKRRYPLLVLLHGFGANFHAWVDAGGGDLMNTAAGFRGVIVMPTGGTGWYTDWWNDGARGSPAWERYHLDQVLPVAERRLRLKRGRRWHAIAGYSMGGEGALQYAAARPGFFGSAASFSGGISIDRPEWPSVLQTYGADYGDVFGALGGFWARGHDPTARARNLRSTRLFVSAGDSTQDIEAELRRHANDFVSAARHAGARVRYDKHPGNHSWAYWKADLRHAIAWGFFHKPPPTHRRWSYKTANQKGWMWGVRFRFKRPPTTLEVFRRRGGKLFGRGSGKARIRTASGRHFVAKLPFHRSLKRR